MVAANVAVGALPEPSVSVRSEVTDVIVTKIGPHIFPDWMRGVAKAVPLEPSEAALARVAAAAALRRYPGDLVHRNLLAVYVVGGLYLEGVRALGTYYRGSIYATYAGGTRARVLGRTQKLSFRVSTTDGPDRMLERTIHHEFSSVLLSNYPELSPETRWSALNPPGFEYMGLKDRAKTNVDWDPELCRLGFLCGYAQTSFEEDFNVLAAEVFMSDPAFWRLVDQHPALKAKVDLVLAFYIALDQRFGQLLARP